MDGLFAGVTLGYFYHFRRSLFDRCTGHYALLLAILFTIPAVLLPLRNHLIQTFGLTGLLFGFSFLVARAVVRTPKSRIGQIVSKAAAIRGSVFILIPSICGIPCCCTSSSIVQGHPVLFFWLYVATCLVGGIIVSHLV